MAAIIPEDANCKTHLWVSGGDLVDSKALVTWSKTGAPTPVASAVIPLNVGSKPAMEGMTGFSDAIYYSTPANSALDTASDFLISFVLQGGGPSRMLYCNGALNAAGVFFQNNNSCFQMCVNGSVTKSQYVGDWPQNDSRAHLMTFGKSSTTLFWKVDNQPVQSVPLASMTYVNPTSYVSYLGRYNVTSTYAGWDGILYEFYMTSTTPTVALINSIHTSVGFSVGASLATTPYSQLPQTAMGSVDVTKVRRITTPKDTIGERQSGYALALSFIERLLPLCRGQDVPGQTFVSGPSTNLWVARVVFRVLKPSWFYGLHPRGNRPRGNFNPGIS